MGKKEQQKSIFSLPFCKSLFLIQTGLNHNKFSQINYEKEEKKCEDNLDVYFVYPKRLSLSKKEAEDLKSPGDSGPEIIISPTKNHCQSGKISSVHVYVW